MSKLWKLMAKAGIISAIIIMLAMVMVIVASAEPQQTTFVCPDLYVDGVWYTGTSSGGSETCHYYTPDTNPSLAYTSRHVWVGNGSDNLPCPNGIHWIDNKNVLTVSHCLPVEEPEYYAEFWHEVDCVGVKYFGWIKSEGRVVMGPVLMLNIELSGYGHFWTDPLTLETSPTKGGTWNSGAYGTFKWSIGPVNEPEFCDNGHEYAYYAKADCEGWSIYYREVPPEGEVCQAEPILIASGKWKDRTTDETFRVTTDEFDILIVEPQNCDECVPEHVFVWFHEAGCNLRQRGGPIGGQTRPFVPMQDYYCCGPYPTDEGWTGRYINSCQKPQEYTYWNELPQFNRPFICE